MFGDYRRDFVHLIWLVDLYAVGAWLEWLCSLVLNHVWRCVGPRKDLPFVSLWIAMRLGYSKRHENGHSDGHGIKASDMLASGHLEI